MNNNRQSVNNFVYQKKNKTQNNNTQSVNNFVYRKNKNNNTEQVQTPPQQNNSYDFTDRNTQSQNNNNYNNNYTSSNNYNSYVSENNYNSYTSSYQPTNNYNNTFNNPNTYSNNFNANQNDYNNSFYNGNNNYNTNPQTYQQNIYPNNNIVTYQNYNTPVNYQNDNSQPIEIPIPQGLDRRSIIILISFLAPFALTTLSGILAYLFPFLAHIVSFLFPLAFISPFVGIIAGSVMEAKRLKSVCTVPVTGHLVGYAKQRRSHKHHHYTVYAPKYEIFINNRREIRTINDFTRGQYGAATANLLANPGGYEIIYAERNFGQSRSGEIIGTIILVIIITCFILPIFFGF